MSTDRKTKKWKCSICGDEGDARGGEFLNHYPHAVCILCDAKAVNAEGGAPTHHSNFDCGDNPVFIEGLQCWRRYKFGGFVTMLDTKKCTDIVTFYDQEGWRS